MSTEHTTSETTLENDNSYQKYKELLDFKNQIIFYGPPGTGKTYHARELAEELTRNNIRQKNGQEPIDSCVDKWFEYFKVQLEISNKDCVNKELSDENFNKNSALLLKDDNVEKRIVIAYLNDGKPQDKVTVDFVKSKIDWLNKVPEKDRFYLIVNLGRSAYVLLPYEVVEKHAHTRKERKSWFDMKISENRAVLNPTKNENKTYDCTKFLYNLDRIFRSDIQFVTFHPSYSYEEFVEGPKTRRVNNNIEHYIDDGVFKKLCKDAEKNESMKFILIIDEINHGNISKILGATITNIEKNSRGNIWTTLVYSKNIFTVPENVFIIGTMNTADRSLTQIDGALRRRFAFAELPPDYSLVDTEISGVNVGDLLKILNGNLIKKGLREKQFGHSYFMKDEKCISSIKELRLVFENEIIPMLQDYFYEDFDEVKDIISNKFIDKNKMSIKTLDNDDNFIDALKDTIQNRDICHYCSIRNIP